jgi:2-aminoadipate transaminase
VDIAARYGVPVIEDDFDSELRFEGEPLPPLKAIDERNGVVHIGTFSKGLFPGLRLGWIVAPTAFIDTLGRSKLISDYHTSLLLQAAVLTFCERGHYDIHLERLAEIYRKKSRTLVAALERHFPDNVTWTRPEGGFAFWVTLPATLSVDAILSEAVADGVLFTPGEHFFAHGDGRRFLRLSISRVPVNRIDEGIERLGNILRNSFGNDSNGAGSREPEPALHI